MPHRVFPRRGLAVVLASVVSLTSLSFATPQGPEFPDPPIATGGSTVWTATSTGGFWHHASTWTSSGGPGVPVAGDIVIIPEDSLVRVLNQVPQTVVTDAPSGVTTFWPGFQYVQVAGTLQFTIHHNTELVTDTLFVAPTGHLKVGTAANKLKPNKTCKITILPEVEQIGGSKTPVAIDQVWDANERSRGIFAKGTIGLFGSERQHVAVTGGEVVPDPSMATKLLTIDPAWNWSDGDDMALAGTTFKRGSTASDPLTDETFDLVITNGTAYAAAGDLVHDHLIANSPTAGTKYDLHLVNLERSVEIRSGWTEYIDLTATDAPIDARGHFMFADGDLPESKTVDMEYVRFDQFGRTDKTIPLDDVELTIDTRPALTADWTYDVTAAPGFTGGSYANPIRNRRGRYSVHFHINGHDLTSPTSVAKKRLLGCVVTGTPGWGFVNHSSHVDFIDCVCHDFAGSAFVTESGDEVGVFKGCVAMHGTGLIHANSTADYIFSRGVFGDWLPLVTSGDHTQVAGLHLPTDDTRTHPRFRPQPLSDFAFGGEGFWFQGPLVKATNNIANSCSGAGMIWFGSGAVNDYEPRINGQRERYAGFPLGELNLIYKQPLLGQIQNMTFTKPDSTVHTGPRTWDWQNGMPGDLVILGDLPINECSGFTCYASLVGMHLRFSNQHCGSLFNERPFRYAADTGPGLLQFIPDERPDQTVAKLKLWNNEEAFRARYCADTVWDDVEAVTEIGGYNDRVSLLGAELNHNVFTHTLKDVVMDGYPLAVLASDRFKGSSTYHSEDNTSDLTFLPGPFIDVVNYSILSKRAGTSDSAGFWPRNQDCRQNITIDSTTISLDAGGGLTWETPKVPRVDSFVNCTQTPPIYPDRFVIRYREVEAGGERRERYTYQDHVTTLGVPLNTTQLSGTIAGRDYEIQIIANFDEADHPATTLDDRPGGPLARWSPPTVVTRQ